jgi:hypothetical protein
MGDSCDHDIRVLGETNWKSLTLNRGEAFEESQGCQANDDDDELTK